MMLYIRLLSALFAIGVLAHLDHLHHTAIFVRQNVTVLYIQTGEIDEAGPHLEVTGNRSLCRRDCESIEPHVGCLEHKRRTHRIWIEDLNDLKRINVNVEWMRDPGILVFDFPLFRVTQFHRLINVPVPELSVVYRELFQSVSIAIGRQCSGILTDTVDD